MSGATNEARERVRGEGSRAASDVDHAIEAGDDAFVMRRNNQRSAD
jgi:hypothetical protein